MMARSSASISVSLHATARFFMGIVYLVPGTRVKRRPSLFLRRAYPEAMGTDERAGYWIAIGVLLWLLWGVTCGKDRPEVDIPPGLDDYDLRR